MKKLFTLLLALPFILGACSSDKDDVDGNLISLKENEKSIAYGDKYTIEATSDKKISYGTENEFHATVSTTGIVIGGRIGETNIVLSNEDDTKKVKIVVAPKSNLYPSPNLDFGSTQAQIIAKYGTPDTKSEDGSGIGYINFAAHAPMVMYLFEENKMVGSAVVVDTDYSEELGTHLGERYLPVASEDYTLFLINALTINKASMTVGAGLYDDEGFWMVMYMPYSYDDTARSARNTHSLKVDALMKQYLFGLGDGRSGIKQSIF